MTSFVDVLFGSAQRRDDDRVYGVVTGVVTDNQDPEGLGRVRLALPWLGDGTETGWARLCAPGAGKLRGFWALPEVADEVLVAFEHGDPRFPYVIGGLWNQNDPPPEKVDQGGAERRSLTSRSGHVVRLDDTDGEEKIEITDGTGANQIVITSSDDGILISADGDITISSGSGNVLIEGADIDIVASKSLSVEASADLDLRADGTTTLQGATVAIN